jgi:hypothetical protein
MLGYSPGYCSTHGLVEAKETRYGKVLASKTCYCGLKTQDEAYPAPVYDDEVPEDHRPEATPKSKPKAKPKAKKATAPKPVPVPETE